jgi:hypothetical protein
MNPGPPRANALDAQQCRQLTIRALAAKHPQADTTAAESAERATQASAAGARSNARALSLGASGSDP